MRRRHKNASARYRAQYLRRLDSHRHVSVTGELYERIGAMADAALVPMRQMADRLVSEALDRAGAPR